MEMTPAEIVRHYKEAANPKADIQVLADLNVTDAATIRAILIEAGELAPGPPTAAPEKKTRGRPKKTAPRTEEDMALPANIRFDPPTPPDLTAPRGKIGGQIGALFEALPEQLSPHARELAHATIMQIVRDALDELFDARYGAKEVKPDA